jgi:hypothetical protein
MTSLFHEYIWAGDRLIEIFEHGTDHIGQQVLPAKFLLLGRNHNVCIEKSSYRACLATLDTACAFTLSTAQRDQPL